MAHPFDRSLFQSRTRRDRAQARRRSLSLECLEDRQLLTSAAYSLFDTGVDPNGNLLAGGASDPHYALTASQQGNAGQQAVATTATANGWTANTGTSEWIAPVADQSNGGSHSPAGSYTYETSANVAKAGSGFIQGSVSADDDVAISINGQPTTFSKSGAMGSPNSFKVFGNFVAGHNTIDFNVTNDATGPTGLQVSNLILDMAPTVTADQPSIMVAYGGTLTATGSFADPDAGDSVSIASSRANGQITQQGSQNGTYSLIESNVTKGGVVTITGTDSQGNITTTTFNLVVTPPSLTAGGQAATNRANTTPTLVDPNIVLTDPDGPNLTSASVSIGTNFTAGEDRLLFTAQNGITGAYNTSTGILTLSGSATPDQYQTALRSVAYQDINTNPGTVNTAARTINFSIAPGTFNPANGHFYQFVRNPGITWTDAKAAADGSSLYGLQGYLATLTSAAENTFAFSKTQSTGWIGASDANTPGHWKWVDGPETGLEFWQGDGTTGGPVNGQYSDWNNGEPNDSNNIEFYAQYLNSGLWNDLSNTATVNGYLIEYGGSEGDPTLQLTSQATMNVVAATAAPTVTSPSAAITIDTATATVAGSAQAGSLVRVYKDANNDGVIDQGDTVVASQPLTASQSSYSIDATLDPNATDHFLVTAQLGSAGESDPVAAPAITSDTIAPVQPVVTSPAATSYNPDSSVHFNGTAEAGSLVTLYNDVNGDGIVDDGDTVAQAVQLVAGATSFGLVANLTPNSSNDFLITATDQAGNVSAPTPMVVVADSIPPAAPVVSDPGSAATVNATTYTITGTAEAGSIVQIYQGQPADGAPSVAQAQAGPDGSYSVVVPLSANAANDFFATATDKAGNQSAPTIIPTITQDSIAPTLPTLTSPATATAVKTATASVVGTAEAGSLIRAYRDTNGDGLVDAGDVLVGFSQMTGEGADFEVDASLDPNASNNLLVTATDPAGNESAALVVPTITQDSIVPGVPTISSPARPTATQDSTVTITGQADAGSLVLIYNDVDGSGTFDPEDPLVGQVQLAAGQTTFSIAVPLAANSTSHFLARAEDKAGNISAPAVVATLTNDTVVPGVPVANGPTSPTRTAARSVTLTGRVEAGSLVRVYRDANHDGRVDQGDILVGTEQLPDGQAAYSMDVALVPNGNNDFLMTATDVAGNVSAALAMPTITSDVVAPVVPVLTGPTGPSATSASTATIAGTAEPGSLVRLYVDANGDGVLDGGDTLAGSVQLGAGQSAFSFTPKLAVDAANRFLVTATDAAGNVSAALAVPTITSDTVAPAVPTTGITAPTTTTGSTTTITGKAEAGSLVQVFRDSNGDGIIDDGEAILGQVQLAPGQSLFSIEVPLAPGDNHFLVASTDLAGNRSTLVAPTITLSTAIRGTVFLDMNHNGVQDDGESPLAGRVVYLDLNNSGSYVAGDPTATTDAQGRFTFDDAPAGAAVVRELLAQDATLRYVADVTTTNADGSVTIAAAPYSALMPMPVLAASVPGPTATDPDTRFVQSLYQSVLGRTGSDAEVAAWMGMMAAGTTRAQVAAGFVNSPEHRTMQVAAYYSEFLHRGLDPGAITWVNQLLAGASEQDVARGILASPEYLGGHANADDLTASLYRDVLGRQGSADEIAAWDAALASGLTTTELVGRFVDSAEAADQAVAALYTFALGRQREAVSTAYWTDRLGAGAALGDVSIGILTSDEFLGKVRQAGTATGNA